MSSSGGPTTAQPTRTTSNNRLLPDESKLDLFQPLGIADCWNRSRRLFKEHFDLYVTISAAVVIPLTILFTTLFAIPFNSELADYSFFEMVNLQVSLWLCNGPLMKLTALHYTNANADDGEQQEQEQVEIPLASQWTHVLVAFWSHRTCRKQAAVVLAVGVLTSVGSLLASIFLYIPGIYCSIVWFAAPCIVLLEHTGANGEETQDTVVQILRAPRRSNALTKGHRCSLFVLVLFCFLGYSIPLVFLAFFSAITRELVSEHVLLGTRFMTSFLGGLAYIVPSMVARIVAVPFLIILKTVVYMAMRVDRESLTREAFLQANSPGWWTNRTIDYSSVGEREQAAPLVSAQVMMAPSSGRDEDSSVVRRNVV